jgi:Dolichyl-phosphate-mannose-protein mannosyltransferase
MRQRLLGVATSIVMIVIVALGVRLAFAWDQARKIPGEALATAPFEQETGSIAHALVTGKGFSNPFLKDTGPTAWLTPVYPLLVAATFKIFGVFTLSSFFFLFFFNAICSSAVCVPLYYVGKQVAGVGEGALAAWLWAVFPSAVMMPFEWIWDTSLTAFLAAALLWATLELAEREPLIRNWLPYGLLWGFTLMVNPSLGSLLPFLLCWAAYRSRKLRTARSGWATPLFSFLGKPAVAVGVAILCCVPWTVRNYVAFHRLVPLRSNFPLELYIGNNENYDDKRPRWPPPISKERETVRYFRMGETAFMDEEMRKAKLFIRSHPWIALELFGDRFVAFWVGIANPVRVFPKAELLVQALIVCATLSGVGALAGMVVLVLRRNPYVFPLAVGPVVFPVIYYVTHTSVRYRHPIDPVVLLLTAIAIAALVKSLVRSRVAS